MQARAYPAASCSTAPEAECPGKHHRPVHVFYVDSPLARRMSLYHGLTDLRNNHFTDDCILPWFQPFYQASLTFCLWAKLTSKHHRPVLVQT